MAKFIKDWHDLVGLESNDYYLEINTKWGCGHIRPKVITDEVKENWGKHNMYLNTHMFYGSCYQHYTELLQKYGFDVQLDNWDK